ncbi:hypothetical protein [Amycolatopsis minnesotensis]|uniref:hypothetical protein n=1 Tax=Amycolatopsis minnesotensis TaxID=337894 RepID=UPI0031D681F2
MAGTRFAPHDGRCPDYGAAGAKQFPDIVRTRFHRGPIVHTSQSFLTGREVDSRVFAGGTVPWAVNYDRAPPAGSAGPAGSTRTRPRSPGCPSRSTRTASAATRAAPDKLALRAE